MGCVCLGDMVEETRLKWSPGEWLGRQQKQEIIREQDTGTGMSLSMSEGCGGGPHLSFTMKPQLVEHQPHIV